MKLTSSSAYAALLLPCLGAVAQAGILYQENFDSGAGSGRPAGWTATGASAGAWGISNAAASSAPYSYRGVDSETTGYFITSYRFTNLAGIAPATTVGTEFDLRIDNYSITAASAATFRVTFRPNQTDNAQYAIGLGFANVGGGNRLFFYAGNGAAPAVNAASAIGYNPGTGFANGFDLGTDVSQGTGGSFYRFSFLYDELTKAVEITATNLANPSQTTTFHDVWTAGAPVLTTGELILTTGSVSRGTMYVDNVRVTAIPEGQHLSLVGAGLLGAAALMRRRKIGVA